MTNCPDCQSPLGPRGLKCRCGWKAGIASEARPHIPCDGIACEASALIRCGAKNFCNRCYAQQARPEARTFSPFVESVKESFARSKYMQRVGEVGPVAARQEVEKAMREPGQDDEERQEA